MGGPGDSGSQEALSGIVARPLNKAIRFEWANLKQLLHNRFFFVCCFCFLLFYFYFAFCFFRRFSLVSYFVLFLALFFFFYCVPSLCLEHEPMCPVCCDRCCRRVVLLLLACSRRCVYWCGMFLTPTAE